LVQSLAVVTDSKALFLVVMFSVYMMPCSDISKVQDDEVGDGTTSVVVFACELLKVKSRIHLTVCLLLKHSC